MVMTSFWVCLEIMMMRMRKIRIRIEMMKMLTWVTRRGCQESTFFPEVNSNLFSLHIHYLYWWQDVGFKNLLSLYVIYIYISLPLIFFSFFPGDKASRRVRMLNDMHLLSRDAPLTNHRGSLILVSDHFFHDPYYMEMLGRFMSGAWRRRACFAQQHVRKSRWMARGSR